MNIRKIVLHVDDDPQITRLVARQLAAVGYEVICLNDPTQTLRVVAETGCQLVILDLDMPEAHGLDLLRALKSTDGGTQVIMLTGLVSMQALLLSHRWGAEYCLFKPVRDLQPLVEAVAAAFQRIEHWENAIQHMSQEHRAQAENSVPEPLASQRSPAW